MSNGEITESQLARMVGMSQPHIHNVLKGARKLSSELADAILAHLRMNAGELMTADVPTHALPFRPVPLLPGVLGVEMTRFEPAKAAGFASVPSALAATLQSPLAAILGEDRSITPQFETGDLILIDQAVVIGSRIRKDGIYIAITSQGPRLRYVRPGSGRIYLASEQTLGSPDRWETVPRTGLRLSRLIRGRVVWVSRQFDVEATDRSRHQGIAIHANRLFGGF